MTKAKTANSTTGRYRLDLGDERLWRGDQPIRISNKAFQLLRLFVRNPNRLLTKDDILEAVWRGLCVSEGLVKEYVHDLRVALGDDPRHPRFIETVRGRGYRFLGGIEDIKSAPGRQAVTQPVSDPPSLAVLPFTNLTGAERWAGFCRGLGDDLMTALVRYPDLVVIAQGGSSWHATDSPKIRRGDHEPVASYALSGSVQASESKVRVNVRLFDAQHGNHFWTEQYERDIGEFLAMQSDIVGQVASAVGGFSGQIPLLERQRLGRKPLGDLGAYELYLLGYELEERFEKQSTLRAAGLLQQALTLEPHFARASLVLAWTCWQIVQEKWADDTQSYRALECEAFVKAAALDPLDPFAVMELAAVRAMDGDITGANDALERALDLGRNQADLLIAVSRYVATVLDDPVRAMQILDKGLLLFSREPAWHYMTVARVAYFAKDFNRAVKNARRGPENLPTQLFDILSLAQLGHREEVQDLSRAFIAKHPDFEPNEFMRDHPITAAGAKRLFHEGVEKAGLA